ncbi:DNA-binding domain-containing protein [Natranaerobius trueperi]|uniref:DNA-binding domain-containing protein n=1 Tax=Natranaerobius trueperi TaxID=759412 RepID=UPI001303957B|nr:DNA-binding domain-containing protein [Natranaerobius trueperi]
MGKRIDQKNTPYKFYIVDDDPVVLDQLREIIEFKQLGVIVGEAGDGEVAIKELLELEADIVIADLLMPQLDGIFLTKQLSQKGFSGDVIILSQVTDKKLITKAYESGIEFYISKPIDEREVISVVSKVLEKQQLKSILSKIRETVIFSNTDDLLSKNNYSINEIDYSIADIKETSEKTLASLGILNHIGSTDIIETMDILMNASTEKSLHLLQNLKELYKEIGTRIKQKEYQVAVSEKAIERRLRRAIEYAALNIAALGVDDYHHPKFERFSYNCFDFLELRKAMQTMDRGEQPSIKINVKKFLEGLSRDIYNQINNIE